MESQDCVSLELESIQDFGVYTQVTARVSSPGPVPSKMWFRIGGSRTISEEAAIGAAVIAMIMPAMYWGLPVRVPNPLDSELLEKLNSQVIPLLAAFNKRLSIVEFQAPPITGLIGPKQSLTPLSGGVDSFFVLLEEGLLRESERTHSDVGVFLFANTGNHRGSVALFHSRAKRKKLLAQQMRIPLIVVDSNVEEFYPPELNFIRSHTMRNASVAYLLSNTVGRFLYAAGYANTHSLPSALGRDDITLVDSVLLPALGTRTFQFESRGGTHSRFEKLEAISEIPVVRDNLDVCVSTFLRGNCSTCWKCRRTLAGLDILGRVGQFNRVFDVAKWERVRRSAWTLMRYQRNPLYEELFDVARMRGFPVPHSNLGALTQIAFDKVSLGKLRPLVGRLRARFQGGMDQEFSSQDRVSVFAQL